MNFNDIIAVAKKELRGLLKSKSILLIALLVPFGITFLSMYSIVFSVNSMDNEIKEDIEYTAYSLNTPDLLTDTFNKLGIETKDSADVEQLKRDIKNKKCDLFISFPENFTFDKIGEIPENIGVWYNSTQDHSVKIYTIVAGILDEMKESTFTVNAGDEDYDVANERDMIATMMIKLVPTVLIAALFFICQSIATESIAGDKERGFLPTVLVTPISRTDYAVGKILGIFSIMMLSGISAFIGLTVSMPIVTNKLDVADGMIFGTVDYLKLFALTMTAVLVIVSVLLLISTLTKNIKEANSYGSVVSVLIVAMSVLSNMSTAEEIFNKIDKYNVLIPIWNSVKEMSDILSFDVSSQSILITCLINILYSAVLLVVVGKCFNSEKLVFGR